MVLRWALLGFCLVAVVICLFNLVMVRALFLRLLAASGLPSSSLPFRAASGLPSSSSPKPLNLKPIASPLVDGPRIIVNSSVVRKVWLPSRASPENSSRATNSTDVKAKMAVRRQNASPYDFGKINNLNGRKHDPYALARDQPKFPSLTPQMCAKGDADYKVIKKVIVSPMNRTGVKLFCGIYTYEKAHSNQVKAVRETWGPKCSGFAFFSNHTEPAVNAIRIDHHGDEAHGNMWQKVREIWRFIAANYEKDFDYFWLGGDDVFLIVENVLAYLNSPRIVQLNDDRDNKGLFLGSRKLQGGQWEKVFNAGGSGYILNRKALRKLAARIPTCHYSVRGFWEDVNVASCLKMDGIFPFDTRDEAGSERFLLFTPALHLNWRPPSKNPEKDWYYKYSIELKIGIDCCSTSAVAFHYVKKPLMYRLYALLFKCDPHHYDTHGFGMGIS